MLYFNFRAMNNNKSYLLIIFIFSCLVVSTACNEDEFLLEDARSELTVQDLYSSPEGFETAVNGMLSLARQLDRERLERPQVSMGWLMNRPSDNVYQPVTGGENDPFILWGDLINSS